MPNNKKKQPQSAKSKNNSADKLKMEAASEVGVNLAKGYNGSMTSAEAGKVGGQMVKKMCNSYTNSKKK